LGGSGLQIPFRGQTRKKTGEFSARPSPVALVEMDEGQYHPAREFFRGKRQTALGNAPGLIGPTGTPLEFGQGRKLGAARGIGDPGTKTLEIRPFSVPRIVALLGHRPSRPLLIHNRAGGQAPPPGLVSCPPGPG
jgi:hypothetical protein